MLITSKQATKVYNIAAHVVVYCAIAFASIEGTVNKYHLGLHKDLETSNGTIYHNDLREIVDGTAARPFVYRRLLADTANTADHIVDRAVPNSWKQAPSDVEGIEPHTLLHSYILHYPIADFDTNTALKYGIRYDVIYAMNLLSSLIIIWSMYGICTKLHIPKVSAICAPGIFMLLLPYLESGGGYAYDYPEIAFFCVAIYAVISFKWWVLIPIAILGTWNKESFLLFIPTLYPVLQAKYSSRISRVATCLVCLASLIVYVWVKREFSACPGGTVEFHLFDQIRYGLYLPMWIARWEFTYGVPLCRSYLMVPFLIWTAVRGWRVMPDVMKLHTKYAAIINIPLFVLFCGPGELRNLSMLFVPLLLFIASNITMSVTSTFRNTSCDLDEATPVQ